MADVQCACGFTEAEGADETIGDHLFEVFAPDDGRAADGLVHLEGETRLFCMCGAGGTASELDAHFLAVFTPADLIGRDGDKHAPVSMTRAVGHSKPGDVRGRAVITDLFSGPVLAEPAGGTQVC